MAKADSQVTNQSSVRLAGEGIPYPPAPPIAQLVKLKALPPKTLSSRHPPLPLAAVMSEPSQSPIRLIPGLQQQSASATVASGPAVTSSAVAEHTRIVRGGEFLPPTSLLGPALLCSCHHHSQHNSQAARLLGWAQCCFWDV